MRTQPRVLIVLLMAMVMVLLHCALASAQTKYYQSSTLTGGTGTAVDGIDGSLLADKDGMLVILDTWDACIYVLDADSAQAETAESPCPHYIQPDANAGTKRWVLTDLNGYQVVPMSGTLAHERGGLEADVSAYSGLVKITGGATSAVTVTAAGEALLDDADASAQRTTLGLVIGTNVQAYDADLTTYAGITPAANVQTFLGAADYAAMRAQLALVIGTNVQAYDADLTTYAGITPAANTQTFLGAADYAAMRTQLGLVVGTNVQAYDADLTTWGGITPSANVQTFVSAADYTAMLATMLTATASEINTPLDGALVALAEFRQLETIGATTISANQWTLLGGIAETLTSAELNILDGVSGVTAAELSYIGDVTGLIQAQLDLKAPLASPTLTGIVTFPIAATPTTDADGEMSFDTDGWGAGYDALEIWNGTASAYVVATTATDTPTNGQVPKWNTGGTITWEDDNDSAGTPTVITVADSTDATSFPAFFESATGDLGPKTDASNYTYNATTGVLTVAGFAGPLTGAVTGNASTATALAANGANAAAGNAILGVDEDGAAEGAFDVWTEAENTAAGYTSNTGDVDDVFDCASGTCATMTVGTSEWLVYGTGYIDANRFAGVTTVDGTEFGHLNGVTSAIQTQFAGKEGTLTNSAGLRGALSDETGTGAAVFADTPTLITPVIGAATGTSLALSGVITGTTKPLVLTSAEGQHDGAGNAAILTDSGESWGASAYVGMTLYNVTDVSSCTVTANNGTTMTCTLTGGTDDDWDATDVWAVAPGPNQGGSVIYIGAATTILHPATVGYAAIYYSTTAALIKVDPQSGSMQFTLNGAPTGTNGEELDSASGAGDFICIHNQSTTVGVTLGRSGTWIDGGAS